MFQPVEKVTPASAASPEHEIEQARDQTMPPDGKSRFIPDVS
jgi:hypothetical protein